MIKIIRLLNGSWTALSDFGRENVLIETQNYREFKAYCNIYGLKLPNRKDVVSLPCQGHYYRKGGWEKVLY